MPQPPVGFCASSSPILKVVSESRVTWATSVPILVFLGLSILDLGPMYATDRRQTLLYRHPERWWTETAVDGVDFSRTLSTRLWCKTSSMRLCEECSFQSHHVTSLIVTLHDFFVTGLLKKYRYLLHNVLSTRGETQWSKVTDFMPNICTDHFFIVSVKNCYNRSTQSKDIAKK